jgi:hypothetical protein
MKITATGTSYGPRPRKTHALVDVSVDSKPQRRLASFRVLIPVGGGDEAARELGVARAKDLARNPPPEAKGRA